MKPFICVYLSKDNQDLNEKLDELKWKERTSKNQLILTALKEFVEKHGDGNPHSTLDQFQDPDFKITPAFFRKSEDWKYYFQKLNEDEWKDADRQVQVLLNLSNERGRQF